MDDILYGLVQLGDPAFGVVMLAIQGFLAYRVKQLEHKFNNGVNAKIDGLREIVGGIQNRVQCVETTCTERSRHINEHLRGHVQYMGDDGHLYPERRRAGGFEG